MNLRTRVKEALVKTDKKGENPLKLHKWMTGTDREQREEHIEDPGCNENILVAFAPTELNAGQYSLSNMTINGIFALVECTIQVAKCQENFVKTA
jgi:hypothetical protein